MIRKLLIANRGEIARRIARTCERLGIPFVAVYSDADHGAPHLAGAAAAVRIGAAPATRSYLDGTALIRAARDSGCDAVHPGFGFLSESSDFAAAVEQAGLIFVGPAPETIAALGDKARAKALMAAAGVPVVPGSDTASADADEVARLIAAVGCPALLKPVAGGGGKGMTVVSRADEARPAIESAVRTARAAFGDGRLLVERLIERPRHVEVQVFGDGRGDVVHLFDRECSLQRRHQKVIEEAPAPRLPEALRRALWAAAVDGARALAYRNAGTFEFIVGADGAFYALEVNARLQVEHPVTEAITGLDLVEWQLRIAAGEPLPLAQDAIAATGHAFECRVYAEDTAAGFRPAPGRVVDLGWPAGTRVDSAVEAGSTVPPHYDPMIAKLIVHGGDRGAALAAMRRALADTVILGLTTNVGFLARLLARPEVAAAAVHTRFVDEALPELAATADEAAVTAAAAAAVVLDAVPLAGAAASPWSPGATRPFGRADLAADGALGRVATSLAGTRSVSIVRALRGDAVTVETGHDGVAATVTVTGRRVAPHRVAGEVGGRRWQARVSEAAVEVILDGVRAEVSRITRADHESAAAGDWMHAEMPGVVVAVPVGAGATVERGDVLAVIEAMKFENPVTADRAGVVAEIACAIGETVQAGQALVRFAS
ncbi:Acetyl-/propionyl-coenzyme A carboxylase alpha chain [Rhodoplanes serenus]|uniref:Acetyl-/propionyl-coenzyme A carboxylase alpha chain n=1 Tax=Rhodoplanes serenus TaxID=200615 RepID=A0A3S4FFB9_9BRAD|nr:biotin carboxylase N-terminal domain-containing protein [Rhodoplanes serenus]VCU10880.1 Acetyl-/propionyl-coenzyme A carboxylase alpha chain [Rhodoplanes serenus]